MFLCSQSLPPSGVIYFPHDDKKDQSNTDLYWKMMPLKEISVMRYLIRVKPPFGTIEAIFSFKMHKTYPKIVHYPCKTPEWSFTQNWVKVFFSFKCLKYAQKSFNKWLVKKKETIQRKLKVTL